MMKEKKFPFQVKLAWVGLLLVNLLIIATVMLVVVVVIFMLFFFSSIRRANVVVFHDMPLGAVNGEWSAQIIAEGGGLNNDIEQLASHVSNVVRAEIIAVRDETVSIGGDPHHKMPYIYSFYSLRVIDIFKGDVEIDDIIEISQIRKRGFTRQMHWPENPQVQVEYIRLSLEVGDDLILFINPVEASRFRGGMTIEDVEFTWIFDRIQGIYRYTPANIRTAHDNWVFESVNEHNNLTLTEMDLLQILEFRVWE